MTKLINLSSDTVTKPTKGMLEYMFSAEVGDDVFGNDPSVNALEQRVADMFGKEAAVFCPSGTMTNQIAIKMHTQPLDEMICHELSHVYLYEAGGYAYNSSIAVNLLTGDHGKITAGQIENVIKPEADWLPRTKLVVLENTTNKAGGNYYTKEEIEPITKLCKLQNLKLHLDGARLFNALVETGESPKDIGNLFDSISICLSKGLGAPVGSLLLGAHEDIKQARRYRKVMGGGMRQAGYLAAAGTYAINHHIKRLKKDHEQAEEVAKVLSQLSYVKDLRPVKTNIIIFDLEDILNTQNFLDTLAKNDILTVPMGKKTIRFVFHLDITDEMTKKLIDVLLTIDEALLR